MIISSNVFQAYLFIDSDLHYAYNVLMGDIRFEWDEQKSRENKRKHGVSFEEAQTVFFDENAVRYGR
jgi:hypothetical protein